MALKGKLTKDKMGLDMPVNAAAFIEKPPYWRGATWYTFNYETNPELAAEIVPEHLTIVDPLKASLVFADYEWSTAGPYLEIIQGINVEYEGEECVFFTQLGVTKSIPLMAGREVYGFPKKVGHIYFVRQDDVLGMCYERPEGIRLVTGVFREKRPMDQLPPKTTIKGITLRVITSPEKDIKYSLVELIKTELELNVKEGWLGEGNCSYTGISELDPWHKLPVRKDLDCTRMELDMTLKNSKIIVKL